MPERVVCLPAQMMRVPFLLFSKCFEMRLDLKPDNSRGIVGKVAVVRLCVHTCSGKGGGSSGKAGRGP